MAPRRILTVLVDFPGWPTLSLFSVYLRPAEGFGPHRHGALGPTGPIGVGVSGTVPLARSGRSSEVWKTLQRPRPSISGCFRVLRGLAAKPLSFGADSADGAPRALSRLTAVAACSREHVAYAAVDPDGAGANQVLEIIGPKRVLALSPKASGEYSGIQASSIP